MNNIIGTKHDFLEYEKLKNIIYQNIDLKNTSLNIYFSNCHSVCYGYHSKSFLNLVNKSPNLKDKYDTIKNLNPLEIKLIKIKIGKLKQIKPLTIVNILYGNGVKPAKNKIASQV